MRVGAYPSGRFWPIPAVPEGPLTIQTCRSHTVGAYRGIVPVLTTPIQHLQ